MTVADPELVDDLELLAEAMFGGCCGGHDAECTCSDDELRCCLQERLMVEVGDQRVDVHEGWVTLELAHLAAANEQELERRALGTRGVRGLITYHH